MLGAQKNEARTPGSSVKWVLRRTSSQRLGLREQDGDKGLKLSRIPEIKIGAKGDVLL